MNQFTQFCRATTPLHCSVFLEYMLRFALLNDVQRPKCNSSSCCHKGKFSHQTNSTITQIRAQTIIEFLLQLRENQKDFNFQLHHRLSKLEVHVVVNLKHIFELFGLYNSYFLIQKLLELITSSSDGQFWRKSQNKKGEKFELRLQLCYYNRKEFVLNYQLFILNM